VSVSQQHRLALQTADKRVSPHCPVARMQAGTLGAQLQAHSLKGPSPLTLQLPISKRVPLEGAELVAYQEQKRKEEMGALQRPAPQSSDAKLLEPLPTRLVALLSSFSFCGCSCTVLACALLYHQHKHL